MHVCLGGVEFFGELDNIGNGYGRLEDDNNFKAGAGAGKIKTFSSSKLKFDSGTISVFAMVGEIDDRRFRLRRMA